jgi:hypothetical protein
MVALSHDGAFATTKNLLECEDILFVLSDQSLKIRDDGTGVMRPLRMGEIQGSIPCHSTLILPRSGVPLILGEFLKFGG